MMLYHVLPSSVVVCVRFDALVCYALVVGQGIHRDPQSECHMQPGHHDHPTVEECHAQQPPGVCSHGHGHGGDVWHGVFVPKWFVSAMNVVILSGMYVNDSHSGQFKWNC